MIGFLLNVYNSNRYSDCVDLEEFQCVINSFFHSGMLAFHLFDFTSSSVVVQNIPITHGTHKSEDKPTYMLTYYSFTSEELAKTLFYATNVK